MKKSQIMAIVFTLAVVCSTAALKVTVSAALIQPVIKVGTSNGNPKIVISPVDGADGYRIYRKTSADNKWEKIVTTKKTSFVDTTWEAVEGEKLKYTVKAYSKTASKKVSWSTAAQTKSWKVPALAIDVQEIYNDGEISMEVRGITPISTYWESDYELKIYVENNSATKKRFSIDCYAVNGKMMPYYHSLGEVGAGKKANLVFRIDKDDLKEEGITTIRSISFRMRGGGEEVGDYIESFICTLPTNFYVDYEYRFANKPLYDKQGLSITYLGREGNDFNIAIKNNSKNYFVFEATDYAINDFSNSEVDYHLFDEDLLPWTIRFAKISVTDDFLSANDISEIETVDFSITFKPNGSYFDRFNTGLLTIHAN